MPESGIWTKRNRRVVEEEEEKKNPQRTIWCCWFFFSLLSSCCCYCFFCLFFCSVSLHFHTYYIPFGCSVVCFVHTCMQNPIHTRLWITYTSKKHVWTCFGLLYPSVVIDFWLSVFVYRPGRSIHICHCIMARILGLWMISKVIERHVCYRSHSAHRCAHTNSISYQMSLIVWVTYTVRSNDRQFPFSEIHNQIISSSGYTILILSLYLAKLSSLLALWTESTLTHCELDQKISTQ